MDVPHGNAIHMNSRQLGDTEAATNFQCPVPIPTWCFLSAAPPICNRQRSVSLMVPHRSARPNPEPFGNAGSSVKSGTNRRGCITLRYPR